MANANGWGDGSVNNNIGWGQAPNNNISWGKSQITSWSGATDIDGGNAPVNTVAPAITGTAQEGQTLSCSTGTWSGSPTYAYQWKRNGSNIGSATNSTYILVTADVGQSIKCTVTATNFIGSSNADSNTVTPTSSVDADAQAFITAAAITDPTEQAAINTLVVDLKGYSIWTKMKAIYPFVGGTSSTHKFNLKNPLDTDAAFRLQFFGGITHSSTGILGNGTNGYFNTFLNTATVFSPSSGGSQFIYVRNNTDTGTDLASFQSFANFRFQLASRNTNLFVGAALSNGLYTTANTDSRGFYGITRPPSSSTYNAILNTNSFSITDAYQEPNSTIFGFALPFSGSPLAGTYSNHELAFVCVADGLTTTEAQTLRTINLTFQTALNRNV